MSLLYGAGGSSQAVPWGRAGGEGDARLPAGTIPSALAEGSSSLIPLARVEGGSQVSPRPHSQRVFILPIPGEWLVLQQGGSSAGTWGDGAGRQAQPEKQPASLSPFPHPEQ